jgi:hypothetical protein
MLCRWIKAKAGRKIGQLEDMGGRSVSAKWLKWGWIELVKPAKPKRVRVVADDDMDVVETRELAQPAVHRRVTRSPRTRAGKDET